VLGIGKYFCDSGVNTYLFYDGLIRVLVLRNVLAQIKAKKSIFEERVKNKRSQILSLMNELEKDNLL